MAEKLLINVAHEETRVALVESGKIQNLEIDTSRVDNNKGNIYKGVVHRVNQSLQAAFVDYGAEKQGFLPLSEIHSRYYPKALKGKRAPIQDVLIQGQELMVQVVKDEIGNKGASLTTFISLPGRYVVLMADSDKTGISRRVESDERSRLKSTIGELPVPEGFGLIVRTAGIGREKEELSQDLEYLTRLWNNLQEQFRTVRGPGIIHQERHIALRFIRDYAHAGIDEIIVDTKDIYEEIVDFCTVLAPELKNRVRHYTDSRPLFSRFQIEEQIDDIFARRIDLPSGGSIVIDQTEALVAIDVNSGRVKTDDIEQTALTTNLEAAGEIARQLKIRDRGGLVVVDFIDMRDKNNIRRVEQAVRDAFESDKAKVKFSRISEFGLMEISRQRLQSSIMTGSFTPCRACGGTGRVRSVESSALYLLRRLKETVIRGNYMHAQARMPVEIANYLLNRKRRELMDLEAETETGIEVHAEEHCLPMVAYIELLSRPGKSKRPRRVLQTIDLVRSDVEKRELEDDEEYLSELTAERTGWTPPTQERGELEVKTREIEAQMALEKERLRAQEEADHSRVRQLELEEQIHLTEARATLLLERERLAKASMNLWGRIKAFFVGMPSFEDPAAAASPAKVVRSPGDAPVKAETADRSAADEQRRRERRERDEEEHRRGRKTRSSGDRRDRDKEEPAKEKESRGERDKDRPEGAKGARGGRDEQRGGRDEQRGGRDEQRGPRDEQRGPRDEQRGGRDEQRGPRDEHRGADKSDREERGRRGPDDRGGRAPEERAGDKATARPADDRSGDRDERGRRGRGRREEVAPTPEVTEEPTEGVVAEGPPGASPVTDVTTPEDEASKKKRRRRRRRKGRGDGTDLDAANGAEGDDDGEDADGDDDDDVAVEEETPAPAPAPRGGRGERSGRGERGGRGDRGDRPERAPAAQRSDTAGPNADRTQRGEDGVAAMRNEAVPVAPVEATPRPAVPRAGGVIDLRAGVLDLRTHGARPATGPGRNASRPDEGRVGPPKQEPARGEVPKAEVPKAEVPKAEVPKAEDVAASSVAAATGAADALEIDAPKVNAPKPSAPKVSAPKAERAEPAPVAPEDGAEAETEDADADEPGNDAVAGDAPARSRSRAAGSTGRRGGGRRGGREAGVPTGEATAAQTSAVAPSEPKADAPGPLEAAPTVPSVRERLAALRAQVTTETKE